MKIRSEVFSGLPPACGIGGGGFNNATAIDPAVDVDFVTRWLLRRSVFRCGGALDKPLESHRAVSWHANPAVLMG